MTQRKDQSARAWRQIDLQFGAEEWIIFFSSLFSLMDRLGDSAQKRIYYKDGASTVVDS